MAEKKQYTEDGVEIWDLDEESLAPPKARRRPPRKGKAKRWVPIQYFWWVYPGYTRKRGDPYQPPYITSRIVEEFRWVELPLAENPIREWDRGPRSRCP